MKGAQIPPLSAYRGHNNYIGVKGAQISPSAYRGHMLG